MASDEGVERDEYSWGMAAKDLALTTHLTLREAHRLCYELEHETKVHPHDAFQALSRLVSAANNTGVWAFNLVALMKEAAKQ